MFRRAVPADLDAISRIYDLIHTREEAGLSSVGWIRALYPTQKTAMAAIQARDMFVLEQDSRIVAAARINQIQGEEYAQAAWSVQAEDRSVMVLHTLVVSPDNAGKGLGKRFVRFYEDYAARNGCPFLRLDTNARNLPARSLYKKLGYKEVSLIPCTFNGISGVQLVCLEKLLPLANR